MSVPFKWATLPLLPNYELQITNYELNHKEAKDARVNYIVGVSVASSDKSLWGT
jgi:hypothetical protein